VRWWPTPPTQRTTAVIVGWFAGCMCKNYKKWYTSLPKLLYKLYSTNAIYKCGCWTQVKERERDREELLVTAVHNI